MDFKKKDFEIHRRKKLRGVKIATHNPEVLGSNPSPATRRDHLGTGGLGYKIHDGACDGRAEESKYNHMTKKQAIAQLKIDIAIAEAYVKKWVTYPLTQAQFDALVSMTFNMGHIPLDILHCVNIGDIKEAAKLFLDYDEANDGSHPQGLHDRRIRERDLFLDGWYGNEACDPVKRMPPGMR
jgi:GH24 family phage-related lysozyme (muramidase)